MNRHDFNRWSPQEPPGDFADRAVAAMLAEPRTAARRPRRGWLGGIGLAAMLLGASAWGMLRAERSALPEAVVSLSEAVRARAPEAPEARAASPRVEPVDPQRVEAAAPVQPIKRPPPKRKPTANREPLCHCESDLAVCGCLE